MITPSDIRGKPSCTREDALAVLRRLRDAGQIAYFAGGCVRDMLLAIEPKDFDVATDAPPQRVRELFPHSQAVGAAFGVVLVHQGRSAVEVATFRSDGAYLDGRHPATVRFTSAEHDAQRRDFTVNGLFFDPLADRVIDYVGGEADLRAHLLRAIGDPLARFDEDHLRMLRAVRFAARFDFKIEANTAAALSAEAAKLKRITPERIADEMRLLLTPPTRQAAWALLWRHGLTPEVFRHLPDGVGAMRPAERSIFLQLAPGQTVSFGLALAAAAVCYRRTGKTADSDVRALLASREVKQMIRALRQGLRISNAESDAVEGTLTGLRPLLDDARPTLAMKKRFLAAETSPSSIELMHGFAAAGDCRQRIAELDAELNQLAGTEVAPIQLLTGDDLTAMGFTPGPMFKRILDSVYDAQLEGILTTRGQAAEMAKSLV